jgi:hypothetical protein
MMIETGAQYPTVFNTLTTPAPRIDSRTSRKITLTLKHLHDWLIENAILNAQNAYQLHQFQIMKSLKNLSQADIDLLNSFLFGQ